MWYGIPGGECPEYPLTYIGETGRMLAMRIKDHLNFRNPLLNSCAHTVRTHTTNNKGQC